MNSLTIKVYIASGYNAGKGKLILNNVEYSFDNVMPDSDNAYELFFGFANPITLPVTGQLFITNTSDEIEPFDHNSTIQTNSGYSILNYDYNNPCYMEFELEQDFQTIDEPSIEFGSVSDPWLYNSAHVSSCNTPTTHTVSLSCDVSKGRVCYSTDGTTWSTPLASTSTTVNNGDVIYIKANPETGYQFQKWSDDSTSNPNTLTVTSDVTMSAVFVEAQPVITHNITLQCDSTKGTVGYSTDGGYNWTTGTNLTVTVYDGDNLEIMAEGLKGQYDFSVWSDGNTNFWRRLTNIQADTTYSATFVTHVFENTMVFTGATVTGAYLDCDNGEDYVWYPATNNTIQFDDGDFWHMKKITTSNGIVSSIDYSYPDGTSGTSTIINPEGEIAYHYEDPGTMNITVNSVFPYPIPDLTGKRFWEDDVTGIQYYFSAQDTIQYIYNCEVGSIDTIATWEWCNYGAGPSGDAWYITTSNSNYYTYDPTTGILWVGGDPYTEIAYDPCTPPAEKHIYLCDNSGAHLAEMTNTNSTWSVSGAFTSGQYSIRATVEGEYDDAWFKFYQTSGDNRVFVGAGDDPSFEDIGTYIMIDDILTSFSLTEDQETGYYVVNYQNTDAMTVSTVETIVNSYVGEMGFVTGSEISAMGYMTQTDISSMGYMTQTDISAMSYVDSTTLSSMGYLNQSDISSMSYVDQISLSSMAYVDNTYLSTYMNAVVGDINSILQTI